MNSNVRELLGWIVMGGYRRSIPRKCAECGQHYLAVSWELARGKGRFCSPRCAHVASGRAAHTGRTQRGEANPNWKGGISKIKSRYRRIFRERFPEKAAAHDAVQAAVKHGRIKKPLRCQNCDSTGLLHGHHADYSKPLSVDWLCAACHRQVHLANRIEEALGK